MWTEQGTGTIVVKHNLAFYTKKISVGEYYCNRKSTNLYAIQNKYNNCKKIECLISID